MRTPAFLFLLFLIIQTGCENLFLNENNKEPLTAIIQNDTFIIKNNLPFDVYFFAVDQELSYVIDWAPYESDENRVKAGTVRKFSTDVIEGYEEGKTAIVFFWDGDEFWKTLEIDQYPDL